MSAILSRSSKCWQQPQSQPLPQAEHTCARRMYVLPLSPLHCTGSGCRAPERCGPLPEEPVLKVGRELGAAVKGSLPTPTGLKPQAAASRFKALQPFSNTKTYWKYDSSNR